MFETTYSANSALGDEMNVVQICYGLVGPNTACHDIHVGGGGGAAAKGEGEVQQARPSIRVSKCQMF